MSTSATGPLPPAPTAPTADPPGGAARADGAMRAGEVAVRENCPLCGTALQARQEWCLGCGAAARTRLAATPRWRAPVIALCVVIVLAVGALTAALVSLAG